MIAAEIGSRAGGVDWATIAVIVGIVGAGFTGVLRIGAGARKAQREEIDSLKASRQRDREECSAEVSELKGEITTLRGDFARELAREARQLIREDLTGIVTTGIAPAVKTAVKQGIAEGVAESRRQEN